MKGFNQSDRQVLESLNRMKSPEMQPLIKFLKEMLDETTNALIAAPVDTVQRLQGRAAMLKELTDAIEKSASVLEKMSQ